VISALTSFASENVIPLAISAIGLVGSAVASRMWSTGSPDVELDKDVSGLRSEVLSRSTTPPEGLGHVEVGSLGVESRRTEQLGESIPLTALITAKDPRITTVITAETPDEHEVEGLEDGLHLVRMAQPDEQFDEDNIERYLSADKAQMVFSTAALQGQGFSRSVDLQKKVEGEEVPDDDRQHKVDVQFAKIKHVLGVGGREHKGVPNKAISYSVTWHFVEVYNRPGEPPVKYDLVDKADIKRLLEDQGIDNVDEGMVDRVFTKLLSINKEIKTLTEREVGKTKDCFLHDYAGNPNGLELFCPFSKEADKVRRSSKRGKYGDTMAEFKFLKKRGGRLFGEYQVNQRGAKALNKIEQAAHLKLSIRGGLSNARDERLTQIEEAQAQEQTVETIAKIKKLEGEVAEISRVMQEVGSSNDTVMHFTLMELTRDHSFQERRWDGDSKTFRAHSFKSTGEQLIAPLHHEEYLDTLGPEEQDNPAKAKEVTDRRRLELSKTIARDYVAMVGRENGGIFSRYLPTKADKQQAIEIGALVQHIAAPTTPGDVHATRRLEVLEATQALNRRTFFRIDDKGKLERDSRGQLQYETVGREVFKDPKGEKLILSAILRPPTGAASDVDLSGYSGASEVVKDILKGAIDFHRAAVDDGRVKSYDAGSAYNAKKVGT